MGYSVYTTVTFMSFIGQCFPFPVARIALCTRAVDATRQSSSSRLCPLMLRWYDPAFSATSRVTARTSIWSWSAFVRSSSAARMPAAISATAIDEQLMFDSSRSQDERFRAPRKLGVVCFLPGPEARLDRLCKADAPQLLFQGPGHESALLSHGMHPLIVGNNIGS